MEEKRNVCVYKILSDDNLMERNKGQIVEIIRKTRELIEKILCQNESVQGSSFYDRIYFDIHKIIVGEATAVMLLSGIYDSDTPEKEILEEMLGNFGVPEDIMLDESFDYIMKVLMNRETL